MYRTNWTFHGCDVLTPRMMSSGIFMVTEYPPSCIAPNDSQVGA
jgi:hypothetical protein